MGFRFSKRITLMPGVRLNISRSGLGLSAGPRGASVSLNRNGVYGNVGLPGTGLSYRTKLSGGGSRSTGAASRSDQGPIGDVSIGLNHEGVLTFSDESGTQLTPAQVKRVKTDNASRIQQMLVEAAATMNEDLDACLFIHHKTTPPGVSVAPPPEFDLRYKPLQPEPLRPDFFDRLIGRTKKIEERNEERRQAYQNAQAEWQKEFDDYDESRRETVNALARASSNDVKSMEVVTDYLLNRIVWPRVTNISFGISECGRVVGIDLDLPDEDEIPSRSATVAKDKLAIKKRTDAQIRRDFVTLAYGSVFRVAGELFAGLPTIQKVVISSYVQRTCKATGQEQDEYVMSSIIDRQGWSRIDFSQIESIEPAAAIGVFELRVRADRTTKLQIIEPFEMSDSYR